MPSPGRRTLRRRLDTELVERGLAPTRAAAHDVISRGLVAVEGVPTPKPATMVTPKQNVAVTTGDHRWASRGGEKLDAALRAFSLDVAGRRCLDVGASTGGFTDVLLERGAESVVALDVGYGQLAWDLRSDSRVEVVERTNFRHVEPAAIGAPFDVIVVDVSFIGISAIARKLHDCAAPGTDLVVLVKPQFEVGRDRVQRGGLVTDPEAHRDAIAGVADALGEQGWGLTSLTPSPITGAKGNREYLLHAVLGAPTTLTAGTIERAVA
jgi:23S rRNA (cytidine1920-2'-O)/16S rRNA (cytidine1409-2'-O)-methyltransferase